MSIYLKILCLICVLNQTIAFGMDSSFDSRPNSLSLKSIIGRSMSFLLALSSLHQDRTFVESKKISLYPRSDDPILARSEVKYLGGEIPYAFANEVMIVDFPEDTTLKQVDSLKWSGIEPRFNLSKGAREFIDFFDASKTDTRSLLWRESIDPMVDGTQEAPLLNHDNVKLDPYPSILPTYPLQGNVVLGFYCPRIFLQIREYTCTESNKTTLRNALMGATRYYSERASSDGEPVPEFIYLDFVSPQIDLVQAPPVGKGLSEWRNAWIPPTVSALGYSNNMQLVARNMAEYNGNAGFNLFATILPGPVTGFLGVANPPTVDMATVVYKNRGEKNYVDILKHEMAHI